MTVFLRFHTLLSSYYACPNRGALWPSVGLAPMLINMILLNAIKLIHVCFVQDSFHTTMSLDNCDREVCVYILRCKMYRYSIR